MKKIIPILGSLFLLASVASVSGASVEECIQDALLGFKQDLAVCKEVQTTQEKRECVMAAMEKARAAKLSCRNS